MLKLAVGLAGSSEAVYIVPGDCVGFMDGELGPHCTVYVPCIAAQPSNLGAFRIVSSVDSACTEYRRDTYLQFGETQLDGAAGASAQFHSHVGMRA